MCSTTVSFFENNKIYQNYKFATPLSNLAMHRSFAHFGLDFRNIRFRKLS